MKQRATPLGARLRATRDAFPGGVLLPIVLAGVLLACGLRCSVPSEMESSTSSTEGAPANESSAPASPPGALRVMVPMRDGIRLETDCYLPDEGRKPSPIVFARSVYTKDEVGQLASLFQALGMGFVVQDTRGRGGSEGADRLFADDGWGENQDGADSVTWIQEQEWCNGAVGGFGVSALGVTQVLMAPVCPSLKCQAIWVAPSTFYGQLSYRGGVFQKQLCENWTKQQDNSHLLTVWCAHPTYDAFWAAYDSEPFAPDIAAPGLHIGGWWDIFSQGTINSFATRHHNGGKGAKGKQKLIIGAWTHQGPLGTMVGELQMDEDYTFDINSATGRFLQYWLTGTDNGVTNEPAVRYYTVGDTSDPEAPGNEWREADDWPPFDTEEVHFHLHNDGDMTIKPPKTVNEIESFVYNPSSPCPTRGGANLFPEFGIGPIDQKPFSERPDVLTFATDPLETPFEATGRVYVKLYVSCDVPDTDFTAKLLDIYPDGRAMLMLDGIQRVKFRNGFTKPEPLSPGEIGELTIDLWSISLVFNKGHRIGLQISSSNYPRFEVNPNTGADFPPPEFTPSVERPAPSPDAAAGTPAVSDEAKEKDPTDKAPPAAPDPSSLNRAGVRIAHNTIHMDAAHPSALVLPHRP